MHKFMTDDYRTRSETKNYTVFQIGTADVSFAGTEYIPSDVTEIYCVRKTSSGNNYYLKCSWGDA